MHSSVGRAVIRNQQFVVPVVVSRLVVITHPLVLSQLDVTMHPVALIQVVVITHQLVPNKEVAPLFALHAEMHEPRTPLHRQTDRFRLAALTQPSSKWIATRTERPNQRRSSEREEVFEMLY